MRKEKNRVAIIVPAKLPVPPVQGGAIESTIQLIIDQNEVYKKLAITIFSPFNKKAFLESKKYKETRWFWIYHGIFYKFCDFLFRVVRKLFIKDLLTFDSYRLVKYMDHEKFDKILIHGNTNHLKGLSKMIPKEKLVFSVHANIFKSLTENNIEIGNSAVKFIAVSDFIKNKIATNCKVEPSKISVIKNTIALDSFSAPINETEKLKIKEKYKINEDDIVILFAGRIVENKGIKHLLKALKKIDNEFKFTFLVVGSFGSNFGRSNNVDSFGEELLDLAEELNNKVIFTGFIHNTKLPVFHAISDILAMPSLCDDAAPKVAMETMASGLPIITTNDGGIPEYVCQKCGIIIDRDQDEESFINDLALVLRMLMDNRELRQKMGAEGKKHSINFSPSIYYQKYVETIRN